MTSLHHINTLSDRGNHRQTLGLFLTLMAVPALLLAPILISEYIHDQDFKNRVQNLDKGAKVIFNDHASCVAAGYKASVCQRAENEAANIATGGRTRHVFPDIESCRKVFDECVTKTEKYTTMMYVGAPMFQTHERTVHVPVQKGWQASKQGLKHALPVYSHREAGRLTRHDGPVVTAP